MTGVGTNIAANDYNNIYNTILPILGQASTGYGRTLQSTQVATNATITALQWNALESDITALNWHQLNLAPNPTLTHATNSIKIRESDRAAYLQMAQALASSTPSTVGGVNYPGCYAVVPTAQSTTPVSGTFPVSSVRTSNWGGTTNSNATVVESNIPRVTHSIQLIWPNQLSAQYFFNAGGQVTFTASRTGGTTNSKNTSWSTLLSNMGTVTFSYAGISSTGSGTGTSYGWSYFNANPGGAPLGIFTNSLGSSGTTLYAPNQYDISANLSANGQVLTFTINFQDLSTAALEIAYKAGHSLPNNVFDVDEDVDGTLTSNVNITYASGSYVSSSSYLPTPAIISNIGP